jgi:rSAM/selenodomain-associated transferase 2
VISVIIPTFNEEQGIKKVLQCLTQEAVFHEILVVDGGSLDKTRELASPLAKVVLSKKGRGIQLNEGVEHAKGEILFFLHGDCLIEPGTLAEIEKAMRKFSGGCLTQSILDSNPLFRFIEWTGNVRARLCKVFYGDQGIFVRKDVFLKLGGYPSLPLFEDIEFTRRLRKKHPTIVLSKRIYTSNRRWNRQGILKTTLMNRLLLTLFYFGLPVDLLSKWYRDVR